MQLRIVNDTDTRAFPFDNGTLVLRAGVRERDVAASDVEARKSAMAAFADIPPEMLKNLTPNEDEQKAAEEAASQPSADERAFRLGLLAISLSIGGSEIVGSAIVDTYHNMDIASAQWVDACVEEVWSGAVPSDADTRGAGAGADVAANQVTA